MPASVPGLDMNHKWYSIAGRLDGTYDQLCAVRRQWRERWTERLERTMYLCTMVVLPLTVFSLMQDGPSPLYVTAVQLIGGLTSISCSSATLAMLAWVRSANEDPEGFIARSRPDLLAGAIAIGDLWERQNSGDRVLGLRAIAGLVAAGGETAVPAHWFYLGSDPTNPHRGAEVIRQQLKLDTWLSGQGLSTAQQEVCRVLGPEYTGSIGELVEACRRLA